MSAFPFIKSSHITSHTFPPFSIHIPDCSPPSPLPARPLRVPRRNLAHRPLPHLRLDLHLHTLHPHLQQQVLALIPPLLAPLPHPPAPHNRHRQRDSHRPVDPELLRHDRQPREAVLEVEEGHREDRREVRARQEQRAQQRDRLLRPRVPLRRVRQLALLARHLEVQLRLALRDDVVQRRALDLEALQRRERVRVDALQLLAVEVVPARHARVEPPHLAAPAPLRVSAHDRGLEEAHGLAEAVEDLHVRARPLPQHLAVALDEVAVDEVEVDQAVLVDVRLAVVDLGAHADGVLELAQPVARLALLDVRLRAHVVAEDDRGQQHRVADLRRARLEVAHALDDVAARRALAEARRVAAAQRVREHQLPAPRQAFLAHVRLAEEDLQVGVRLVGVQGAPEEGPDGAAALDAPVGEMQRLDHLDIGRGR